MARTGRMRVYVGMCAIGAILTGCSPASEGTGSSPVVGGPGGSPMPLSPLPPPPPPPSPPPPAPPVGQVSTVLSSQADASRFLTHAAFGGTAEQIEALQGRDAADWVSAQMDLPATQYLPTIKALRAEGDLLWRHNSHLFWDGMVSNEDQLRSRVTFALSQILVANDANKRDSQEETAYYMDVLSRNALGNYRDLLDEVTYSPLMARMLTYYKNRKGNPKTGRMPDENYARELLQLFTIGLVELNMDGTPKPGSPATYDNDDIEGLARVFTGLASQGGFHNNNDKSARHRRLQAYAEEHSTLPKKVLTITIPAGTPPDTTIDMALDEIFSHPNVAPFVSRQLIQRLTASHPSPDYVERVATAFETGRFTAPAGQVFGTGERGDLSATVAAIVLDRNVFSAEVRARPESGKIREPVLKFVHWARAFEASPARAADESLMRDLSSPDRLGQHPFQSPSVFNFYRPGFVASGTQTGKRGLTAPEFQIVNEGLALGYINTMTTFATGQRRAYTPNYAREIAIADNAVQLVDHLNILLTAGRMDQQTHADIVSAVETIAIRTRDADARADRTARAHLAVSMVLASPAYAIQY